MPAPKKTTPATTTGDGLGAERLQNAPVQEEPVAAPRLGNLREGSRVQVRPGGQFAIVVGFVPGLDERKGRVLLTDDVDGKTAAYSVPSENVKEVI